MTLEDKIAKPYRIWVVAEQRAGRLMDVSVELVGKAQELCQKLDSDLAAILIGDKIEALAQELIDYGVGKVYLIEHPQLQFYESGAYATLLAELTRQHEPEIVLIGATTIGRDLASRVAAKLRTGLTAHCIDLNIDEVGQLIHAVPGWGGNLMVNIVCQRKPQIATIKAGIMTKPERKEGRQGEIVKVAAEIKDEDLKAHTVEMVQERPTGTTLEEADVVVAGGWGMHRVGGFSLLEQLAEVLGGVVGGTRPAMDKGWISGEQLIGQSGKTVSPRLFVSVGASGAMHFTTGFLRSKVILAIDRNPKAPIFEVADIGIVGDLEKILPLLLEELYHHG